MGNALPVNSGNGGEYGIYCAGGQFRISLIPTVTIGMCRFVPLSVYKFIGVIGAVKCIYLYVVSNDLLKRAQKLISDWLPCLFVHQTAAEIGSTENINWKAASSLECTNPIFVCVKVTVILELFCYCDNNPRHCVQWHCPNVGVH